MKKYFSVLIIILSTFFSFSSYAGMPQKISDAINVNFPKADPHRGLEVAYENVDPSKIHCYVVVEQGGIPAERARYFISWDDYDYRGVVVHLDKDEKIATRSGAPYAYLQKDDVMMVADVKYFNDTIYFKLISADIYKPEAKLSEKKFSRVTVMLGFKFPKRIIKSGDAEFVIKEILRWLNPIALEK